MKLMSALSDLQQVNSRKLSALLKGSWTSHMAAIIIIRDGLNITSCF